MSFGSAQYDIRCGLNRKGMQQVLDNERQILPNTWAHRNPVKLGVIVTIILLLLVGFITREIRPIFRHRKYEFTPMLQYLMVAWNLLIILITFLPPILTQYFYRAARTEATYIALLLQGSKVNICSILPLFLLMDMYSFGGLPTNNKELILSLVIVPIVALLFAVFINAILALFFRKKLPKPIS